LLTLFLALKKGEDLQLHTNTVKKRKKERKSLLYSESQRAKMLERQKAKGVETGKEEKDDEEAVVLPSP